jgi:hypothetical protein
MVPVPEVNTVTLFEPTVLVDDVKPPLVLDAPVWLVIDFDEG